MSNLLTDTEGRNVVLTAQRHLLERRIARFFKRNLVIDYAQWSAGGQFDLDTLLGDLNEGLDQELRELYRLLGHVGGLQETVQDEEIYVNPAAGSDETGTGDTAAPYASLWFLANLPRIIRHQVSVILLGDVDYDDILTLCHQFEGEGCLNIIGQGAAVDPYGGVLNGTISAHTAERNTWNFVTLSVNPTNACYKYFWRPTSGGAADNAAAINTADDPAGRIWVRFAPTAGIANTDSYTYALPAHTLRIEGASLTALNGWNSTSESSLLAISRINFINLNIDLDPAPDRSRTFVTSGAPMGFWFVRILAPDDTHSAGADLIFRNPINRHNPATSTSDLETQAASGLNNLFLSAGETPVSAGLMVVNREADIRHEWNDAVIALESDARIYCVDCMARWEIIRANVELRSCSARSILVQNGFAYFNNVGAVAQFTGAATYDVYLQNARATFFENLLGGSDTAIVLQSAFIRLVQTGGDGSGTISFYDYCVDLTGISKVFLGTAWQGTVPTINDIIFNDPAAPVAAAFPAIDAVVTDALENSVMRT
jgi:hypothetical protein